MRKNCNRGTYNTTKIKVLLFLSRRQDGGNTRPIGAADIAEATGTNYNYLKSRLKVWASWRYLESYAIFPHKGRPIYGFTLGPEGIGFIQRLTRKSHPAPRPATHSFIPGLSAPPSRLTQITPPTPSISSGLPHGLDNLPDDYDGGDGASGDESSEFEISLDDIF